MLTCLFLINKYFLISVLISHILVVNTIDVAHIKVLWRPQSFKSTKGSLNKKFENYCYNPMSTSKIETKDV